MTVVKQKINVSEYEKRVEIEAANLMYFEYLRKDEAFKAAEEYVASKFVKLAS